MNGYTTYDAMGLAELIRSGEVKPAELLEAARTRAGEVNPRINAIVVDIDPAAAVEDSDAPFSGVPFLIKDLLQHLAGYPTSGRSRRSRLPKLPPWCSAGSTRGWSSSARPIHRSSAPAPSPSPSCSVPRATRGTPTARQVAPLAVRPPRSPLASCRVRAPATAAVQFGSRRRPAGCSASRPPAA